MRIAQALTLSGQSSIWPGSKNCAPNRELTQQELAEAVDVTRATIIALEKGSYNPSLELAFRIAKVFKLGVDKVFFED